MTTNSEGGIESYEAYYPVFEAMQEVGMVLNLHGEVPSDASTNTCVLNAEPAFLPHLRKLHAQFPKLRIVLEHATTRAAVDCVKSLGDTVACTITPHHLALTVDDWAGQSFNFCKPVAKYPDDKLALQEVVKEGGLETSLPSVRFQANTSIGHPRFFLGSDSAPHPPSKKATASPTQACAAGVYTSPILLPLVAHLLESFGALDKLEGFSSANGRAFYRVPAPTLLVENEDGTVQETAKVVTLERAEVTVNNAYASGEQSVVPFWAGKTLNWKISR